MEILREQGHEVVAPDLPGMGGDEQALREASLDAWADFTADLCRDLRSRADGPVILAGHSRGGLVISATAEKYPDAMSGLVYIAALMCPDENGLEAFHAAAPGHDDILAAMQPEANGAGLAFAPDFAPEAFYHRSPANLAEAAVSKLVTEPAATLASNVPVTADRWGRIPRTYIECTDDRTLDIAFQRAMIGLSPGTQVVTLDADHSPFYSATEELAEALLSLA
ncbi:hypothetical protein MB02_06865 [Croceicoccus estronivorus]|nr:hypothetical protein MB02_06865 [Croceicoccus estronivorus]